MRPPFLLLSLALAVALPMQAQQPVVTIEDRLRAMTLPDKVAQLIMPWVGGGYSAYDDPTLERVSRWVDSLHIGGVVISIGSPLDIAARLNHLQRQAPLPAT